MFKSKGITFSLDEIISYELEIDSIEVKTLHDIQEEHQYELQVIEDSKDFEDFHTKCSEEIDKAIDLIHDGKLDNAVSDLKQISNTLYF